MDGATLALLCSPLASTIKYDGFLDFYFVLARSLHSDILKTASTLEVPYVIFGMRLDVVTARPSVTGQLRRHGRIPAIYRQG